MQAQDFAGALWSVGLRTGATRDQVVAAHEGGAFVRSWPMRGTLHLIASEDLPWMLDLTGARTIASAAGRHRQLSLGPADFARSERIARRELAGATRTRAQLLAAFDADGLSTAGQRGAHLLGRLAHSGVAALTGKDRWALLEPIVGTPPRLDHDVALRRLALRYLHAHGPATAADLAWWAGITLTDARAGIDAARDELEPLGLDGVAYWMRPGLEPAAPAVHLLPGFDEFLLGYTDRSAPLAGAPLESVVPGSNGMFLSTIVVNGEVAGTWRRAAKGPPGVVPAPYRALTASQQQGLDRAARRYVRFLG
ncbi:hypothetical protein GCM10025881_33710 [Pseudolysinimonas kribbensis]|uniref:Winged helix DNA-binding domain-containing protein n=2 Tax=Pseudolysinimonas kribbensis TaxID=433641 RepID=A0ABQ6K9C1_9MICO|nr:hypothetical protein GCM10025881_33710 [Pseudolysinimonas kribbensis]